MFWLRYFFWKQKIFTIKSQKVLFTHNVIINTSGGKCISKDKNLKSGKLRQEYSNLSLCDIKSLQIIPSCKWGKVCCKKYNLNKQLNPITQHNCSWKEIAPQKCLPSKRNFHITKKIIFTQAHNIKWRVMTSSPKDV